MKDGGPSVTWTRDLPIRLFHCFHNGLDYIITLVVNGGVSDANGVLRNKFVLLHLVSEPSW